MANMPARRAAILKNVSFSPFQTKATNLAQERGARQLTDTGTGRDPTPVTMS